MKDGKMEKGQSMERLYESWSKGSAVEDTYGQGKYATRTLERFKETISEHWGPMDAGMWKWEFGSDELTLIVKRWDDLGPDIDKTGLVKLTLRQIEGMIHPEDLRSLKSVLIAHMDSQAVDGLKVDFRVRGKSGDWRWVRVGTEAIQSNHEGRPARAVGCFVDVTEVYAILEPFGGDEGGEAVAMTPIRVHMAASLLKQVLVLLYLGYLMCMCSRRGVPRWARDR
jgi:hypothetical protein